MRFIAHRGNNNHSFKENTKDALINCLNQDYIAGIECDVRITKDKKIVINHNMLISDKKNNLFKIKNKTLKEIKKINSSICTLEEFLKEVKQNKILLIEIKEESDNFDIFIIILFNLLKKFSYLNIYICSFNYKLVKKIKSKYSNYKCGLIIGYLMNIKNIDKKLDFFLYSYNYIDLIDYNKEIFIFVINNKDKLAKLETKIKVPYYIISDNAYLLI